MYDLWVIIFLLLFLKFMRYDIFVLEMEEMFVNKIVMVLLIFIFLELLRMIGVKGLMG